MAKDIAGDWAWRLDDLPSAFDAYSEGARKVARATFNPLLLFHRDKSRATARTLELLHGRGFEPDKEGSKQHDEVK